LNCTTILVGKKASTTGYPLVTHSNDSDGTQDSRLLKVSAAKFEPNSKRPIFPDKGSYPRLVTDYFGPQFTKDFVDPKY